MRNGDARPYSGTTRRQGPRPRGPGQRDPRQQGVLVRVKSRRLALLYVELDETRRDWGINEYDYLVLSMLSQACHALLVLAYEFAD